MSQLNQCLGSWYLLLAILGHGTHFPMCLESPIYILFSQSFIVKYFFCMCEYTCVCGCIQMCVHVHMETNV